MATEVEVTAIGESMALLTPSPLAPIEQAVTFRMSVAGAESNVAMYLADLGHRSAWVSRVGDDPLGRRIVKEIGRTGVDVSAVGTDPRAPSGVYFKDVRDGATTVHYYRAGSAASRMGPELLTERIPQAARVVHCTGITPALSSSCRDLVRAIVVDRALPDVLVSFDVNHRPGLWPATQAAPVLAELADASDLVFVGLDEAQRLWGCETPADVRERLAGPATIVVKDAAAAAHHLAASTSVSASAPTVAVVEEVGAGDAFAAGYLAGLLRDLLPQGRLRLGHLVAAHALQIPGDHAPLPAWPWFEERLGYSRERWSTLELAPPTAQSPGTGPAI
jgi:2-dehydro-3-deoxygluconokinase